MSIVEIMLIILTVTVSNVIVFFLCQNQQDVHTKKVEFNPVKIIKKKKIESEKDEEADLKQRILKTELSNIDVYAGDSTGQQDIPMN